MPPPDVKARIQDPNPRIRYISKPTNTPATAFKATNRFDQPGPTTGVSIGRRLRLEENVGGNSSGGRLSGVKGGNGRDLVTVAVEGWVLGCGLGVEE